MTDMADTPILDPFSPPPAEPSVSASPAGGSEPDPTLRECDMCGESFTGNRAPQKLGSHKRTEHGIIGARNLTGGRPPGRPKKAASSKITEQDREERPVLAAVRDVSSAIGSRKGVPTKDDLARGLGRGLGLSTVALASYMVESDPNIPEGPGGDQVRDGLIDYLSLPDKAAVQIMTPVGRALAPTSLNRRYGRQIVDNVDLIGSFSELGILAMHWRRYLRMRSAGTTQVPTDKPAGVMEPPPTFDPGNPVTTPPPQRGVVLTANDVAEARAAG